MSGVRAVRIERAAKGDTFKQNLFKGVARCYLLLQSEIKFNPSILLTSFTGVI